MLQYLIDEHRKRGDKILVFVDYIQILVDYARRLNCPYICGDLKTYEREKIIQFFQHLGDWNVLFMSRTGDLGIDLPDANVAIEVCSLFGSRRQEAQRLGRILRPKEKKEGQAFDAFFYTLVSTGTEEMRYALKRQKFLIKQGYSFQILDEDCFSFFKCPIERSRFKLSSDKDQLGFLEFLMSTSYKEEGEKKQKNVDEEEKDLKIKIVNRNNKFGKVFIDE